MLVLVAQVSGRLVWLKALVVLLPCQIDPGSVGSLGSIGSLESQVLVVERHW